MEKKLIFDQEEYKMIIDELKDQVKLLRGVLKKNGFEYDYIKQDSILNKIMRNDEFASTDQILNELRKIKKISEKLEFLSDTVYSTDSDSGNKISESIIKNSLKKFNLDEKEFLLDEEFENIVGNEKIFSSNSNDLSTKYEELKRKYKKLLDVAGHKINKLENKRLTLIKESVQIFEDIKQEAVYNLNIIIETKSKEINNLNDTIEDLKIQIMKKETEMGKKLMESQKENNTFKFIYKKLEIQNNTLNDFINTYQSDILLLQSKIEKKSNFKFK